MQTILQKSYRLKTLVISTCCIVFRIVVWKKTIQIFMEVTFIFIMIPYSAAFKSTMDNFIINLLY
jgi:flagellar motor switch protein FliM